MSQDKLARRRFLADLLFVGGALAGAALLAQSWRESELGARSSPSPDLAEKAPAKVEGNVRQPTDRQENLLGGFVAAPVKK